MKEFFHTIAARVRGFLRRDELASDFDQELQEHLTLAAEEKIRRGLTPEDAHRAARLELGGVAQLREAGRAARGLPWLESFGLDVRLGLRMLRKSWGLTLIGGLAMAVAISIGVTAVAVIDAFQGNTLPLEEGDRVVRLLSRSPNGEGVSVQDLEWWREQVQAVEDISGFYTIERILVTPDGSDGRVSVAQMTSSGFRVARVQPFLGRPLLEEDERAGATPVVVIGYDLWQSRFAGDRAAVGQTVQLGGVDHVVAGIMPEDFRFPFNHQLWISFRANPLSEARPASANIVVFGRLSPGLPLESAQAEIAVIGPAPGNLQPNQESRADVASYTNSLFFPLAAWWDVVPWLLALLLVPVCANIAILSYARNVSRQDEFAARYVLGASRGRIVGQLLIEAFVLAAAAGGVGLSLATQFLQEFQRSADENPGFFPFWVQPHISLETVLYVAGLATFAAMVAGGLPALRATGPMRQSGFHGLGSRTSPRLGLTWTTLVVMQVALCTAILPRAGQMIWMQLNPNIVVREFVAEEYVTARIVWEDEQLPGAPTEADPQFAGRFRDLQGELVQQIQAEFGISGAAVSASIDGIDEAIRGIETDIAGQEGFTAASNQVDAAYFEVYEASLQAGRAFEAADFDPGRRVVIVNRTFADLLSGQNPLGRRVRYTSGGEDEPASWYEIVGIVDQISANTQRPSIYHPLAPGPQRVNLTLRVGPTVPSGFVRRLLEISTALNPNLQVEQLRMLDDVYQQELREDNYLGLVFATPVLVVLLFSMAGIHTLVAFAVAERRREIGIRSALGAPPLRLVADVFRRDLSPIVVGAMVGALLTFPLDKLFPRNVGLSVTTLSASAALMFMVAMGLLAIAGPARRLLRVDSTEALRD